MYFVYTFSAQNTSHKMKYVLFLPYTQQYQQVYAYKVGFSAKRFLYVIIIFYITLLNLSTNNNNKNAKNKKESEKKESRSSSNTIEVD